MVKVQESLGRMTIKNMPKVKDALNNLFKDKYKTYIESESIMIKKTFANLSRYNFCI